MNPKVLLHFSTSLLRRPCYGDGRGKDSTGSQRVMFWVWQRSNVCLWLRCSVGCSLLPSSLWFPIPGPQQGFYSLPPPFSLLPSSLPPHSLFRRRADTRVTPKINEFCGRCFRPSALGQLQTCPPFPLVLFPCFL